MDEIENSNEIFTEFKKFCAESNAFNAETLRRMKEDLEVSGGKPFLDEDMKSREGRGFLNIGFNYIRPYCNALINMYRKTPFGIVVTAKIDTTVKADFIQSVIRGIEKKSRALQAYIVAFDRLIRCGRGYFAITTDYSSESDGFDQEIKFEPIFRPDMVIDDPLSTAIDGGDATKRALISHISEDSAKELYGEDVESSNKESMACFGSAWSAPVGTIAVATYYRLRKKKSKIYLDDSGNIKRDEELRENDRLKKKAKKYRTVTKTECEVYKIVGCKVVSKTVLPITYIPVIACRGELVDRKDSLDFVGIVYYAKNIIRMMSYYLSESALRINKSPRSIIPMDVNSMAPYQNLLASGVPSTILPYLSRDPKDPNIMYPPPTLLNAVVDVSDLALMHDKCKADLSTVLGMSEQGIMLDAPNNRTAVEVLTSAKSQEVGNIQYLSNFSESLKLAGRVVVQMLTTIYDTPRKIPVDVDGELMMQEIDFTQMDFEPENFGIDVDSGPMNESEKTEELYKMLALADMADEQDKKKLLPKIAELSNLKGSKQLSELLGGASSDVGAEQALMSAEEAVTALEQTVQAYADRSSQDMLYIQQLQGELSAVKADNSATIYKAQMDYKKTIDKAVLDNQSTMEETKLKILADAEKQLIESRDEYLKVTASRPEITVVQGYRPDFDAVGNQRNDLFQS